MAAERCHGIVGEDMDIVADIAEITLAAINADGLQRHGIGAVGDVGGEDDCTVLLDLEGRHVVLDGNDHVLAATVHTGLRHPYPIDKDLRRQRRGKEHKGSKKKDGYGVFHCRQKIKDEKQTTAYKSGMVIPKGGKVERTASGA